MMTGQGFNLFTVTKPQNLFFFPAEIKSFFWFFIYCVVAARGSMTMEKVKRRTDIPADCWRPKLAELFLFNLKDAFQVYKLIYSLRNFKVLLCTEQQATTTFFFFFFLAQISFLGFILLIRNILFFLKWESETWCYLQESIVCWAHIPNLWIHWKEEPEYEKKETVKVVGRGEGE